MSLASLRGKPVIVNFWPRVLPGLLRGAPLVEATWRKYKDQGLVMVGVVIQDKEPNAREFMRRFNYTFPNGPGPRQKISIDFGVYGVPETFFIDRQGRIAYKHVECWGPS